MDHTTTQADGQGRTNSARRDPGTTFVEILVAIVLLGTVVVAVLAGVRTTVIATSVERDHAKAHQWLLSAVGVIEAAPFATCGASLDGEAVRTQYQSAVDAAAQRPYGFDGAIEVQVPEVWTGSEFVSFDSQTQCYDGDAKNRQQRLRVDVRAVDGVTESVEMIKVDR